MNGKIVSARINGRELFEAGTGFTTKFSFRFNIGFSLFGFCVDIAVGGAAFIFSVYAIMKFPRRLKIESNGIYGASDPSPNNEDKKTTRENRTGVNFER